MNQQPLEEDTGFKLVYFFADWCSNCRHTKLVLNQIRHKMGKEINIVEIDIDNNPMVSAAFKIRSLPTLILFRNDKSIWKHAGQIAVDHLTDTIISKMKTQKIE